MKHDQEAAAMRHGMRRLTYRIEAGVVSCQDGRQSVVAAFTRAHDVRIKHPAQDSVTVEQLLDFQ
jgi:hypothetical protein